MICFIFHVSRNFCNFFFILVCSCGGERVMFCVCACVCVCVCVWEKEKERKKMFRVGEREREWDVIWWKRFCMVMQIAFTEIAQFSFALKEGLLLLRLIFFFLFILSFNFKTWIFHKLHVVILYMSWKIFFGYFLGLNSLIFFVNYFCLQTKLFMLMTVVWL